VTQFTFTVSGSACISLAKTVLPAPTVRAVLNTGLYFSCQQAWRAREVLQQSHGNDSRSAGLGLCGNEKRCHSRRLGIIPTDQWLYLPISTVDAVAYARVSGRDSRVIPDGFVIAGLSGIVPIALTRGVRIAKLPIAKQIRPRAAFRLCPAPKSGEGDCWPTANIHAATCVRGDAPGRLRRLVYTCWTVNSPSR